MDISLPGTPKSSRRPFVVAAAVGLASWAVWGLFPAGAQEQGPSKREVSISASKYAYSPALVEVHQDDVVKVTFRAEDIAHSFTVDAYRISKRASAGQAITFEFRADQPGRFAIYCDLKLDESCRDMHGELVVHGR